MKKDMVYNLRILILETYVRITMIGYESKQKRYAEKFARTDGWRIEPNGRPAVCKGTGEESNDIEEITVSGDLGGK